MTGNCPQATDVHHRLRRIAQIDTGRLREPGSEPVGRRSGVDETELRHILQVFDLHRNDRAHERTLAFAR